MFMILSKYVPCTADGHVIYPGMVVFVCSPYSTVKSHKVTIYSVGDGESSEGNNYSCVISENRYYNGEYWEEGNTESVCVMYADETECLRVANEKYAQFLKEQEYKAKK
jgi:hypothetical protein